MSKKTDFRKYTLCNKNTYHTCKGRT